MAPSLRCPPGWELQKGWREPQSLQQHLRLQLPGWP